MANYYEILGISKEANPEEIKKAYRQKVKTTHPDIGGDAEAFKKVQEAYETLSDTEKKKQYDQPSAGPQGAGNFHDPFMNMFHEFSHHFHFNPHQGRSGSRRGGDIRLELHLTTKESYFGGNKTVRYRRTAGGKTIEEVKNIAVPPNCDNGTILKIRQAGHAPAGTDNPEFFGDLLLYVTLIPDPFHKQDIHLLYEMQYDPIDLLLGKQQIIPHYDGDLNVSIPAGVNPAHLLRVAGKGFKYQPGGQEAGDLLIKLSLVNDVVLPEALKQQLKQFKEQKK